MESVLRYCNQNCSLNITHITADKLKHQLTVIKKQIFDERFYVMCSSRYGLPVNFQAMLLQPNKKTLKKLREVLNDLYKHLDSSAAAIIDVSTDNII